MATLFNFRPASLDFVPAACARAGLGLSLGLLLAASPLSAQLVRTDNDLIFTEFDAEIPGTAEPGDCFGCALAVGDFNRDGFDDMAIGVPGREVDGLAEAGRLIIIPGSASGPDLAATREWDRNEGTVKDSAGPDEEFGGVMVVGDFNGDGFDDLALGIPNAEIDLAVQAGEVAIFHGSVNGLTAGIPDDQLWRRSDLLEMIDGGDLFGAALAAGDVDGDGFDDLAIGAPGIEVGGADEAGAAYIIYGSSGGLSTSGRQRFDLDEPFFDTEAAAGDHFGDALAMLDLNGDGRKEVLMGATDRGDGEGGVSLLVGTANGALPQSTHIGFGGPNSNFGETMSVCDFNNDGYEDVVVGAPRGEDESSEMINTGFAVVLLGGVDVFSDFFGVAQGLGDVGGVQESFDLFGQALAAADFDADGFCDLAVGVPGESFGVPSLFAAGWTQVIPGSADGLDFTSQDLAEGQDGVLGIAEEAELFGVALAAGDLDGDGAADLVAATLQDYVQAEDGGSVHAFFGDARLFADSFEEGNFDAWSFVSGN